MQDEILDFWFAPRGRAEHGQTRELWFRKDAAVDQSIRARFGAAVETALAVMPVERWFLYMPFEHAEEPAAQETSLELFARLRDETGLSEPVMWAERHAAVIRRFGRYPHRNGILGRESTAEEIEYLATVGRGF